jgi:hypothetical protein
MREDRQNLEPFGGGLVLLDRLTISKNSFQRQIDAVFTVLGGISGKILFLILSP